ncbi:MAG: hypothetical protein ACI8YD_003296 [Rheinheimera aquimaris]
MSNVNASIKNPNGGSCAQPSKLTVTFTSDYGKVMPV